MAEEQALEAIPKRKSVLPKLLIAAAVMLIIAAAVNWKDIRAIAAGEKTVTSVLYGKAPGMMGPTFSFPEPLGPEDAKVKVWVIAQEGNDCHRPLVSLWMGVSDLEPEHLRVEFYNASEIPPTDGEPLEVGCDSGVAINGETKFEIGEGDEKRTIYLTGPTPMPSPAGDESAGPSPGELSGGAGHGWGLAELAAVVNDHVGREYGEEGTLTPEAIQEAALAADQRVPTADSPEKSEEDKPSDTGSSES